MNARTNVNSCFNLQIFTLEVVMTVQTGLEVTLPVDGT